MARLVRPKRPSRDAERDVEWLMDLAALKIDELDPSEIRATAHGTAEFITRRAARERYWGMWSRALKTERSPALRDADPREKVKAIHRTLREILEDLQSGRGVPRRMPFDETVWWDPQAPPGSDRRFHRSFTPPKDSDSVALFVDRVFDLLDEVGPWLELCARDGCGRFFLIRRLGQRYCSASCANRVAMATYLAGGGRLGRPRRRPTGGK